MIRNIVMVKLTDGADPQQVAEIQDGLRSLDVPGTLAYTIGTDAGLREGNWSWAIVADFRDAEAYRVYDLDAEHNRLRAELAPHCADTARLQFELPDPA